MLYQLLTEGKRRGIISYGVRKMEEAKTNELEEEAISAVFELFPLCRRVFFDALYENDDERVRLLTKVQFLLMTALIYRGRLNMTETALCISASKEQATRIVAPLVDAGLVERFYERSNRRTVYIRLSDKGMAFVRSLRARMAGFVLEKLSDLNPEDIKTLEESAVTLARILRKIEK